MFSAGQNRSSEKWYGNVFAKYFKIFSNFTLKIFFFSSIHFRTFPRDENWPVSSRGGGVTLTLVARPPPKKTFFVCLPLFSRTVLVFEMVQPVSAGVTGGLSHLRPLPHHLPHARLIPPLPRPLVPLHPLPGVDVDSPGPSGHFATQETKNKYFLQITVLSQGTVFPSKYCLSLKVLFIPQSTVYPSKYCLSFKSQSTVYPSKYCLSFKYCLFLKARSTVYPSKYCLSLKVLFTIRSKYCLFSKVLFILKVLFTLQNTVYPSKYCLPFKILFILQSAV